jgi:class 3 adenylate cyclase
MTLHRCLLCLLLLAEVNICRAQAVSADSLKAILPTLKDDTAKVDLLLTISRSYLSSEPQLAIPYATQAEELSRKLFYEKGIAVALKNLGIANYQQSRYIEALENWNAALLVYEQLKDISGIANIQSNIGAIYKNQGNDSKALEYLFNSLRNSEETNEEFRICSALINIGSVYQHKSTTYDKALQYYLRALPMSEKLKDNDLIGTTAVNIGEIYLEKKNSDSALYYFKKAETAFISTVDIPYALNNIGKVYNQKANYELAKRYHKQAYDSAVAVDSKLYQTQALQGLGIVSEESGDYTQAIKYYTEAERLSKEINSAYDLKDVYAGLARSYSKKKEFAKAFDYQELLVNIKDTIYNKETDLKLSNYEFNFEIEKKQGQINLLEKDKALQDADLQRQKLAKNAAIIGFSLILAIAFILYRNYRNKIKVNKLLDSQKAQIEQLLLNILPAEVAKELQQVGYATPRYYDNVSVLFTDFKGFTSLAENMSPQEVVAELNDCFIAFDEITEKHGLEKIKTIGDSYMCAGGIPIRSNDHPINIIKAAADIQRYMYNKNQKRMEEGLPLWEIRIGIHTGPLVAGVVGKNKYAYDIWGRTVNIASRMESNGAPGEINISSSTYELVKDVFKCHYRGKIYAKNVGDIDMYFVQNIQVVALTEAV